VLISAASLFHQSEPEQGIDEVDWAKPWLQLDLTNIQWQGGLRCATEDEAFIAEWDEGAVVRLVIWRLKMCVVSRQTQRAVNLDLVQFEMDPGNRKIRLDDLLKKFLLHQWPRLIEFRTQLMARRDAQIHAG
jgi:hypothetical protein